MATYLNVKKVRSRFKEYKRQLSKDGLHAIDVKVEQLITRLCTHFNGHHKRIDAKIVELFRI